MLMTRFIHACTLSLLFSGCLQQIAMNSLGGIMDLGFEVINEEQDLDIAEKSIASNLKLLETILRSDQDNQHYLQLACQGYASYALGFAEDDSADRAKFLYLRARDFGMRSLNRNSRFATAVTQGGDELRVALNTFSRNDLPIIFWTATAWGSYASLSLTDPAALADLPKVEIMMRYVVEKDPAYFYGGAHFFLGTLYGSRPTLLGGNPDSSRAHFDACLKIGQRQFLMPFVYYARSYAVQTQNQELFDQYLTFVDTTSIDVLPSARLSNAIAKRKAKLLRERTSELF